MTQTLGLKVGDFQITMINILKDLVEEVDNTQGQTEISVKRENKRKYEKSKHIRLMIIDQFIL